MIKLIKRFLAIAALLLTNMAIAQVTVVSGIVKASKDGDGIAAASITIKNTNIGTYTDDKGKFNFTTSQKPPFVLVITSVGYGTKEISYNGKEVSVTLDVAETLGNEVTVSASRVAERVLESPVTVERVTANSIKNAPAANYYDILSNMKGIDVVTASLTFKSVGTRGFNSSGNLRLNQIVDGMDNQAPGLNFSVGAMAGLTELDVESMELLAGASSALYGPGGMNGTVIMNSKDPFKYQGLSFQSKLGVNHIDNKQRDRSPYYDWAVRYAKKINDKFAYKVSAQLINAQDWLAMDNGNYSRTSGTTLGQAIAGNRYTDPNYDGINLYGDETTLRMNEVAGTVMSKLPATVQPLLPTINGWLALNPTKTITDFNNFLNAAGASALVASGMTPIIYGNARGYYTSQSVSRTGYNEKDVVSPTTLSYKLSGAAYYKINDKITASLSAYFGGGNTVYTGSDRYSLKDLKIGQYKLELKAKTWFLRAYTTQEDAGSSYNSTITTRLFNEAWKASSTWYPTYLAAYATAKNTYPTLPDADLHTTARNIADQGRPTGYIADNPLFQKIASTPISKGGGMFVDKTNLYELQGQWQLTDILGLNKDKTTLLVGGNAKQYLLNSQGTLFADTAGKIKINEVGAYVQLTQKLLGDVLKLTASGRYDKNSNFEGKFTPRVALVAKIAENQNIRASYQTAYRFPSTQNQWINLLVSGGIRLMGGLPQLRDGYNFASNPAYTVASVTQFAATGDPTKLVKQDFGTFKPESMQSYEVGYKGLFGKRLLVDAYYYMGSYNDFIGSTICIQANDGKITSLGSNRTIYNISTNLSQKVDTKGWGVSVEYQMPNNYYVNGNVYSDEIGSLPAGYISYFNTPKYRGNVGFGNTGFLTNKRAGFAVNVRHQQSFYYEGTFAVGNVPAYTTVDAMISYKFPTIKTLVKLGGTNIFNKYYQTGFGNPSIGGLYYISFGYNVF